MCTEAPPISKIYLILQKDGPEGWGLGGMTYNQDGLFNRIAPFPDTGDCTAVNPQAFSALLHRRFRESAGTSKDEVLLARAKSASLAAFAVHGS